MTVRFVKRMRRHVVGIRLAILVVAVALTVFWALTWFPTPAFHSTYSLPSELRILFSAFLAYGLRIALSEASLAKLARSIPELARPGAVGVPSSQPQDVDQVDDAITACMGRWANSAYAKQTAALSRLLVSPSDAQVRISQNVTLFENHLSIDIDRTLKIVEPLVFPVLSMPKGSIMDRLTVEVEQKPSTVIPYAETQGFILAVIWSLFDKIFAERNDLLVEISRLVVRDTYPAKREVDNVLHRLAKALKGNQKAGRSSVPVADEESLKAVCRMAMLSDFILISLTHNGDDSPLRRIKTTHVEAYSQEGMKNSLRSMFGLARLEHSFDLPYLTDSQSFHLETVGPVGTYVQYSQLTARSYTGIRGVSEIESLSLPVIRYAKKVGDNRAHLYVRGIDELTFSQIAQSASNDPVRELRPAYEISFREKPTGLIGPIAAVSMWIFVVTWGLAFYHDIVFDSGKYGFWAPIIYGIPAIVTGWLLSKALPRDADSLSPSTFVALCSLAFLAAVVLTISALKASGVSPLSFSGLGFEIKHGTWFALMALTAFHFFLSGASFLTRAWRYSNTVKGKHDHDQTQEEN